MKLTKLLLEYPGAFTPAPDDEVERNQEDIKKRNDPYVRIEQYIKYGSEGDLYLNKYTCDNFLLTSLPDNLNVDGNLDLSGCRNLKELPKGLRVKNSLYIVDSDIKELPEDIYVGKSINASNSELQYLPDDLALKGYLNLVNCDNFKELPNRLYIQQTLNIAYTNIRRIPDGVKVKGEIIAYGSLLESLPDNITLTGSLTISDTSVSEVPYNLKVYKDVVYGSTPLDSKYTIEELRKVIEDRGGFVRGVIHY